MATAEELWFHYEQEESSKFPRRSVIFSLAQQLYELGDYARALSILQVQAKRGGYREAEIWLEMSKCYRASGDLLRAHSCLEKCLSKDPTENTYKEAQGFQQQFDQQVARDGRVVIWSVLALTAVAVYFAYRRTRNSA
eukprot:gb/GEZN01015098.1/.p1 GENE.gb/GEZN01015098.1/~~gb/GEZN01015098.1/.p1  ORF type:complete len:138 (-),score=20.25 gb/GEZN01015098.1/:436-849(-)